MENLTFGLWGLRVYYPQFERMELVRDYGVSERAITLHTYVRGYLPFNSGIWTPCGFVCSNAVCRGYLPMPILSPSDDFGYTTRRFKRQLFKSLSLK